MGGQCLSDVTVKVVDFDSVDYLTDALNGQDGMVNEISSPDLSFSMRLMDAAPVAVSVVAPLWTGPARVQQRSR